MKLTTALRGAVAAARANLLPGLLLQFLMLIFLIAYELHDGTRHFLAEVAHFKQETGYLFAFVSYVLSAALLPELLIIAFFQRGKVTRKNIWNFLTAAPAWGLTGILVDCFYRCQVLWLGPSHDLYTILAKMVVDQFIFSPFLCTPLIVIYYIWRDAGYKTAALRPCMNWDFYPDRVLPVQAAGWCIWIPGVCLIYFMPSELQIPVAALIEAFWVLVFTVVHRPASDKT